MQYSDLVEKSQTSQNYSEEDLSNIT